jgi:hypothetical protein
VLDAESIFSEKEIELKLPFRKLKLSIKKSPIIGGIFSINKQLMVAK